MVDLFFLADLGLCGPALFSLFMSQANDKCLGATWCTSLNTLLCFGQWLVCSFMTAEISCVCVCVFEIERERESERWMDFVGRCV